jgi:hypothetical protein
MTAMDKRFCSKRSNVLDIDDLKPSRKHRIRFPGVPNFRCAAIRATGITVYLENKATLEVAQKVAAHERPRTTKLYDRTDDQLTLDEIEKISV